ncbi:hypothetical protein ABMA32_03750 [Mesorhizobium sp. VNQ89]|uniref:hypothetical protein n=1 Tax=Mesorhizobium quangtriensis TaxID=3157709 RepID=UPI0032B784D2
MQKEAVFLSLADFLIPAHKRMPKFSDVCSFADAQAALDFRVDLKDAFDKSLQTDLANGAEAHLENINQNDKPAFSAVTTIAITTYYMNPRVRELIGYPGQENVQYDPKETQVYVTDGSLGHVVARGRKYRPTPGL